MQQRDAIFTTADPKYAKIRQAAFLHKQIVVEQFFRRLVFDK